MFWETSQSSHINSGTQLAGVIAGRSPLLFFENREKVPWFCKKSPDFGDVPCLCVSIILRASCGKRPKFFHAGPFFCVLVARLKLKKQSSGIALSKNVLRNFAKFTEKHFCGNLFYNKVAGWKPETVRSSHWRRSVK